ncbi:hypothetical protein ACFQQB_51555 [Nonomuraea rubra]|uniref:hypothetical protein n=1 Tax=Nonomuraea rubra TaxID=46180 RepID=UPI00361D68BD
MSPGAPPGVLVRERVVNAGRRLVALDLGTARTRSLAMGGNAMADLPSVIARGRTRCGPSGTAW